MKKSQLLELLQKVKAGNVKIDDAITQAETSRHSLIWQETNIPIKTAPLAIGFFYRNNNGKIEKLPIQRDGKVFQPYYRSLEPKKQKAKQTA